MPPLKNCPVPRRLGAIAGVGAGRLLSCVRRRGRGGPSRSDDEVRQQRQR